MSGVRFILFNIDIKKVGSPAIGPKRAIQGYWGAFLACKEPAKLVMCFSCEWMEAAVAEKINF